MALPIKIIAAVATTTAAASAAAYIAINTQSVSGSADGTTTSASRPAHSSSAPTEPVNAPQNMKLCVAPDRVLHANREGEDHCPAGQEELQLAQSDQPACDLCDPFNPPSAESSGDVALDQLRNRIHDLEYHPYFEVLDAHDQPIFQLIPGGARFLNGDRVSVATVVASEESGVFSVFSGNRRDQASIGGSYDNVGVQFTEDDVPRLEVGRRHGGPFGLRITSSGGLIAGIGESRAGTGAMTIGSSIGQTLGILSIPDHRAMMTLLAARGSAVALAEAKIGGGLLDIANANGDSAVKMGHNGQRYGIVLAGPILGFPLVPRSGVTGSYFMGCASGERPACVPGVAEQ